MKRLEPIQTRSKTPGGPTSINLSIEQLEKVDAEVVRIGARGRSDLIRMIIDLYFEDDDE